MNLNGVIAQADVLVGKEGCRKLVMLQDSYRTVCFWRKLQSHHGTYFIQPIKLVQ